MYYSYKHLTPSSFWTVSSLSEISTTRVIVPNNKIEKVKPNISTTLFLNLHLLLYTAPFCSCYASSVPLTSLVLPVLHNYLLMYMDSFCSCYELLLANWSSELLSKSIISDWNELTEREQLKPNLFAISYTRILPSSLHCPSSIRSISLILQQSYKLDQ